MPKKPPRQATTKPRPARRRDPAIAEVPTFPPDPPAAAASATPPDPAAEDAANDAVRRMVEAAYT